MATLFIRDFPEDLHEKAKIRAVKEKTSLREIFSKALREYLKKADQRKEG